MQSEPIILISSQQTTELIKDIEGIVQDWAEGHLFSGVAMAAIEDYLFEYREGEK